MVAFSDLPLQRKLSLVVLLAILVALTSSIMAVLVFYHSQARQSLSQELQALASITSQRSSAALLFNDKKAMQENLQSLLIKHSVEAACVFKDEKELFAAIDRNSPEFPRCVVPSFRQGVYFEDDTLLVIEPVLVKGRTTGTLVIRSTLEPIYQQLWRFLGLSLLAATGAFGLAYLITARLTQLIARPITELTGLTQKIRQSGDYSLRAEGQGKDETGQLVHNFNDMVSRIQLANMQMDQLLSELKERSVNSEAEARDMARRHDAIRDFFAGVTHDLRQPLQAMDMYLNILQDVQSLPERNELQRKLKLAVVNLGEMFRELLDASRFEARVEQSEHREPVSLRELLDNLCHEFDALAGDKGLQVRTRLRDAVVLSDRTMLSRIIRNLVSNGIRYTEQGGLLVAVRVRPDQAWVEVWDTGRGIPADKQQVIFNQFTQVQEDDSEKGHGLGLAIVKRLANALGHPLELASVEGKGTRFRLILPLAEAEEKIARNAEPVLPVTLPGAAETLLLIDDDAAVLDSLSQMLSGWQFGVVACSGAQQALDWAQEVAGEKENWPALIISDYHLPEQRKGSGLLQALEELFPGVPGFIMTSDQAAQGEIKSAGFKMLPKPVKPAKLRALIQYFLARAS